MLKMCGPQIWLCLFKFRPITSKQLKSLTTSDTLSWLSGTGVTHLLWVREVPGSIPCSGKGFYVWFFVLLLLCFTFCPKALYLSQILHFLLQPHMLCLFTFIVKIHTINTGINSKSQKHFLQHCFVSFLYNDF